MSSGLGYCHHVGLACARDEGDFWSDTQARKTTLQSKCVLEGIENYTGVNFRRLT